MTRLMILPAIFVAATLALWVMIRSAPGWSAFPSPSPAASVTGAIAITRIPAIPSGGDSEEEDTTDHGGGVAVGDGAQLRAGKGASTQKGMGQISLPTQFDNFTAVAEQFRAYKEEHYIYITTLFVSVYLYKQTFAIPGSFLLVGHGVMGWGWRGGRGILKIGTPHF